MFLDIIGQVVEVAENGSFLEPIGDRIFSVIEHLMIAADGIVIEVKAMNEGVFAPGYGMWIDGSEAFGVVICLGAMRTLVV